MKISIDHACMSIKGMDILDDISCTFESGHIYGLQGHNGSGKTMLMRMVGGFIYANSGSVTIDGQRLGKDIFFPDSMGVLIEGPAFLDDYDGLNNLKMIASIKELVDEPTIVSVLERVGLQPNMKKKYRKYSLGMKQRLGIAAAVMENPDLVLLDEPTNALDTDGIDMLKDIIADQKKRGALVILASHDSGFLDSVSDRIFQMSDGKIRGGCDVDQKV